MISDYEEITKIIDQASGAGVASPTAGLSASSTLTNLDTLVTKLEDKEKN